MKYSKYFVLLLFLLLCPFFASAKIPVAKDLVVRETSGNVYVEPPLVDGDVMTPIVGFGDGGATISYQFRLQFDTYLYSIDSITDNNKNQSLKNDYSFKGDKVYMTMHYDHTVHDVSLKNYQIIVKLKANKKVNPKTGNIWFIIFVAFTSLLITLLLVKKKRKVMISIILLLVPILVSAKETNIFKITVDMSRITMGYKVHFDMGISSDKMSTIVCLPDRECVLPKNSNTNSYLQFLGWATYPDGVPVFSDQQIVYDLNEMNEKDVTLYAKWKRSYRVHFDGNGATSGSMDDIICDEKVGCTLPNSSFQKTGLGFGGWSTSADGDIVYYNGASPIDITEGTSVTLYAIWKEPYTIHYNGNGATSGSMADTICLKDVPCTLRINSFEKSSQIFGGWSTTSTGSSSYGDGGSYTNITTGDEITLYAYWMVFDYKNFSYTGAVQTFTIPASGNYKLEVWGAEGGYRSSSSYAGKGGYSYGTVSFTAGTVIYVYVGGAGGSGSTGCGSTICAGGFNGGGYRYKYYGGGGASDIRIRQDSLYARVIVAGGGGSDGASNKKGMYGGGTSGGSSSEYCTAYSSYCGQGGTQTYSGYSSSYTISTQAKSGLNSNSSSYYCGGFGFGGGGVYLSSGYGGAGGGGWYGGSGNVPDSSVDDDRGGGGGSGYVYTSSTASNYPSGCLLNSSYYLTNASTIAGNTSFTSPSGGTETGHSGNGYARITFVH